MNGPVSEGAKVTAQASTGAFVGGTSTIERLLTPSSDGAEALAYWLPDSPARALVTAYGNGSTAPDPKTILVSAAPVLFGPALPLARNTAYTVTLTADGTLASCTLAEVVEGAATVKFVDPDLGAVSGQSLVEESLDQGCENTKTFKLELKFTKDARDGAAGTLRCTDTFRQVGSYTFSVEEDDGNAGAGGK